MQLLLTGASSFTGCWFAQALADDGHTVVAPLRGPIHSMGDPQRAARIARLAPKVELIPRLRIRISPLY